MPAKNIVLVTGASSGIGAAISRKFSSQNYEVILSSRSKDKLINLNKEPNKIKTNKTFNFLLKLDFPIKISIKKFLFKSLQIFLIKGSVNSASLAVYIMIFLLILFIIFLLSKCFFCLSFCIISSMGCIICRNSICTQSKRT